MLRTAEQIADWAGIDTQDVIDFVSTLRSRPARIDGQTKYWDEATQGYIRTHVKHKGSENHD